MNRIKIIGAGLAGCEAAYYLANKGHKVMLYDMKPVKYTKAHSYKGFAELVCSNSLKSTEPTNASGLLKEEMKLLGSLVMEAAYSCVIPAGGCLAVDRIRFSDYITEKISLNKNIDIISEEVTNFDEAKEGTYTIVSTGPLTTDALAKEISKLTGKDRLYFFDAAAPVITYESIDLDKVFWAARYNKGSADYLNCPMDKNQYDEFYEALLTAKKSQLKDIDKDIFFEGCMPIEELAKRGYLTPLFGPMKPVGIVNSRQPDKRFHAIVQLRRENSEGALFNMVGFQTRLLFEEQKRVFRLIPGLESAQFARYGVMHRNTYINSPALLDMSCRLKSRPDIYFAGQMTGVEGYLESAVSGIYTAIQLDRHIKGLDTADFTKKTCTGALMAYITDPTVSNFQPMNANFGIMEPLSQTRMKKTEKKSQRSQNAITHIKKLLDNLDRSNTHKFVK